MSSKFNKTIRLAKVLLQALEKGDKAYTELMKATMHSCGSPKTYRSVLSWLKRNEYVKKRGRSGTRAPYAITEKGREYLRVL